VGFKHFRESFGLDGEGLGEKGEFSLLNKDLSQGGIRSNVKEKKGCGGGENGKRRKLIL